jgi:membrane-bound lytic murein transglycosylase A
VRFVILVPKSLDPLARGRAMPLPDARPSAKIAKLFPQTDALKETAKGDQKPAAVAQNAEAKAVPLPEARPQLAPARPEQRLRRHYRYHRYYHYRRYHRHYR